MSDNVVARKRSDEAICLFYVGYEPTLQYLLGDESHKR